MLRPQYLRHMAESHKTQNYQTPREGTLWKVTSPGLLATVLHGVGCYSKDLDGASRRHYLFENVVALKETDVMLYAGDEEMMVSHWHLQINQELQDPQYYTKFIAAVMLVNEKRVYLMYDDYSDIWRPGHLLMQVVDSGDSSQHFSGGSEK